MKKFILLMLISGAVLADSETTCLAEIIYHEARGAGDKERTNVANLAINLAKRNHKTVCSTMRIKNKFDHVRLRFKPIDKSRDEWKDVKHFTDQFVSKPRVDTTNGATLFHNVKVHPSWDYKKLQRTVSTKYHHYYREREQT